MKKRNLAVIAMAVFLVIGTVTQAFAESMKPYVNKQKGFTISFPNNWQLKEKLSGVDVIALSPLEGKKDIFRENVNVIAIAKLPPKYTLKVFYDENVKDMKKNLNKFTIVSEKDIKINGVDAKKLVYTHNMYKHTMKASAFVIAGKEKACFITCTATPDTFAKWDARFDTIAKTFKF